MRLWEQLGQGDLTSRLAISSADSTGQTSNEIHLLGRQVQGMIVSLHELIPMARRYHRTVIFILGSGVSVIVYALLAMFFP